MIDQGNTLYEGGVPSSTIGDGSMQGDPFLALDEFAADPNITPETDTLIPNEGSQNYNGGQPTHTSETRTNNINTNTEINNVYGGSQGHGDGIDQGGDLFLPDVPSPDLMLPTTIDNSLLSNSQDTGAPTLTGPGQHTHNTNTHTTTTHTENTFNLAGTQGNPGMINQGNTLYEGGVPSSTIGDGSMQEDPFGGLEEFAVGPKITPETNNLIPGDAHSYDGGQPTHMSETNTNIVNKNTEINNVYGGSSRNGDGIGKGGDLFLSDVPSPDLTDPSAIDTSLLSNSQDTGVPTIAGPNHHTHNTNTHTTTTHTENTFNLAGTQGNPGMIDQGNTLYEGGVPSATFGEGTIQRDPSLLGVDQFSAEPIITPETDIISPIDSSNNYVGAPGGSPTHTSESSTNIVTTNTVTNNVYGGNEDITQFGSEPSITQETGPLFPTNIGHDQQAHNTQTHSTTTHTDTTFNLGGPQRNQGTQGGSQNYDPTVLSTKQDSGVPSYTGPGSGQHTHDTETNTITTNTQSTFNMANKQRGQTPLNLGDIFDIPPVENTLTSGNSESLSTLHNLPGEPLGFDQPTTSGVDQTYIDAGVTGGVDQTYTDTGATGAVKDVDSIWRSKSSGEPLFTANGPDLFADQSDVRIH